MLALRGVLGSRPGLGLAVGAGTAPQLAARWMDQRGPKLAKAKNWIRTWKLRPGDRVFVNSGKDKGSTGEVLMTDFKRNMVKVRGCNLRKVRDEEGNYKFIEKKIHYSNCALIDPVENTPTRIGLTFTEQGEVIRLSHRTGRVIPWPDDPRDKKELQQHTDGPKDTPPEKALEKTYDYHADNEAVRLARLAMAKYNYNR
mmetsp:Transcript_129722/g.252699  ORF Transcript_129722/g.252699 Transcript_129722/m.252699 type:complete len:199 (-) Transcript_129722:60-656(-)